MLKHSRVCEENETTQLLRIILVFCSTKKNAQQGGKIKKISVELITERTFFQLSVLVRKSE
jgi:hypothetical protein